MTVRFQADADLNQIIVKAALRREPTIDFQTAHTARLSGLNDREVLDLAARENRMLVTHDRKTMPQHFAAFIQTATSAGLLIVPEKKEHCGAEAVTGWQRLGKRRGKTGAQRSQGSW